MELGVGEIPRGRIGSSGHQEEPSWWDNVCEIEGFVLEDP